MTTVSRRSFFGMTAAGAALAASARASPRPTREVTALSSLTRGVQPITAAGARRADRQAAIADAAAEDRGTPGRGGIQPRIFHRHPLAAVRADDRGADPGRGWTIVVTPFFEAPSIRESLKMPADVRPWNEDESPFALIAGALRDRPAAKARSQWRAPRASSSSTTSNKLTGAGRAVVSGDEPRQCLPHDQVARGACLDAGGQRRHDCGI